jgi:hypothetical protein
VQAAGHGPKLVRMQNMTTKRSYRVRRSRAEWTAEVIHWRKSEDLRCAAPIATRPLWLRRCDCHARARYERAQADRIILCAS